MTSFISSDLLQQLSSRTMTPAEGGDVVQELLRAALISANSTARNAHTGQRMNYLNPADRTIGRDARTEVNQLDFAAATVRLQRAAADHIRTSFDPIVEALSTNPEYTVDLGPRTGSVTISRRDVPSLGRVPAQHVLDTLRDAFPQFRFHRNREYLYIAASTSDRNWNTLTLVEKLKELASFFDLKAWYYRNNFRTSVAVERLTNEVRTYMSLRASQGTPEATANVGYNAYAFAGRRGAYYTTTELLSQLVDGWQTTDDRPEHIRLARTLLVGSSGGGMALPERIPTAAELRDRAARFEAFYGKVVERNVAAARVDRRSTQPSPSLAADAWNTIPILEHGTLASRTWGIEIEVVAASYIARGHGQPAGWDRKYDGSLRDEDDMGNGDYEVCDNCEYDQDDCSCEDGFQSRGYTDSNGTYAAFTGAQEFVSPILKSFHSKGVETITADLRNAPSNNTPGVHVHVGADDLTGKQLANIVSAYTIIEPLLAGIYSRNTRQYCQAMTLDKAISFSNGVNKTAKMDSDRSRREVASVFGERYRSVNLLALQSHTTIEYRAMGPVYNYEHLIRWAWFVREFTNVAAILPLNRFAEVTSLEALIALLVEYGKETPSNNIASKFAAEVEAMTAAQREREFIGA